MTKMLLPIVVGLSMSNPALADTGLWHLEDASTVPMLLASLAVLVFVGRRRLGR